MNKTELLEKLIVEQHSGSPDEGSWLCAPHEHYGEALGASLIHEVMEAEADLLAARQGRLRLVS